MEKLLNMQMEELLKGKFECSCGREHFASIPIESERAICEATSELIQAGSRVFVYSCLKFRDFVKGIL